MCLSFVVGVSMNNISPDFPEVSIRPSMLAHLGRLICAVAIVIVGIPISEFVGRETGKDVILQTFSIFLLFGALIILGEVWRSFNKRFCLCKEYVSVYAGLLGANLRTTRLLYEHVRGVEIEQSVLQRLLGLGDLHVGSDVNKGEGEMVICGIRNPDKVKDLLLERVRTASHTKEQMNSSLGVARGIQ